MILLRVRWYLAYGLSLGDLKEMMVERGGSVDHATEHRWVIRYSPELLERFNLRKRTVGGKWHMDETYIRVGGQWTYLYRANDSLGDTVEVFFSKKRDLAAAKCFLPQTLDCHGRRERIVIDGNQQILKPSALATRRAASRSLAAPDETDPDPPEQISEQPD